jgi:hypothetical protein
MVVELSHEVVVSFMRWLFREATTSFSLLALSPPYRQKFYVALHETTYRTADVYQCTWSNTSIPQWGQRPSFAEGRHATWPERKNRPKNWKPRDSPAPQRNMISRTQGIRKKILCAPCAQGSPCAPPRGVSRLDGALGPTRHPTDPLLPRERTVLDRLTPPAQLDVARLVINRLAPIHPVLISIFGALLKLLNSYI